GLVLGDRIIDTRSEWRTFSNSEDNGDDPSRVGAAADPLLGSANQLDSTMISQRDGNTGLSRDLSRVHGKATNEKAEKTLRNAFKEIQAMCERIGLAKITVDSAKQMYKRVDDEKTVKGKNVESVMAACIYIACRQQNSTRTFKEICALTKVSKKEIGRTYKQLQPLLENKIESVSLSAYITRFASALDLPPAVQKAAHQVTEKVDKLGTLAGKSPISVVAGCLYFVAALSPDAGPSAADIAKIAGCTEATLKNAYKILLEKRHEVGADLIGLKSLDTLPPA
ncbi:cyclin-like protein, partial [Blyttiomyces helicus]